MTGAACLGVCWGHQTGEHRDQAGPEGWGGWLDWHPPGHPLPKVQCLLPLARLGQKVSHRDLAQAVVRGTGPRHLGCSLGRASLPLGVRVHSLWETTQDLARVSPGSEANCPDNRAAAPGTSPRGKGGQGNGQRLLGVLRAPHLPGLRRLGGAWEQPWLPPPPICWGSGLTRRCGRRAGSAAGEAWAVCVQSPGVPVPSTLG